jgi:hypothetical protein
MIAPKTSTTTTKPCVCTKGRELLNKLKPIRDRVVAGAKKIVDAKKATLSF